MDHAARCLEGGLLGEDKTGKPLGPQRLFDNGPKQPSLQRMSPNMRLTDCGGVNDAARNDSGASGDPSVLAAVGQERADGLRRDATNDLQAVLDLILILLQL